MSVLWRIRLNLRAARLAGWTFADDPEANLGPRHAQGRAGTGRGGDQEQTELYRGRGGNRSLWRTQTQTLAGFAGSSAHQIFLPPRRRVPVPQSLRAAPAPPPPPPPPPPSQHRRLRSDLRGPRGLSPPLPRLPRHPHRTRPRPQLALHHHRRQLRLVHHLFYLHGGRQTRLPSPLQNREACTGC